MIRSSRTGVFRQAPIQRPPRESRRFTRRAVAGVIIESAHGHRAGISKTIDETSFMTEAVLVELFIALANSAALKMPAGPVSNIQFRV